MNEQVSRGGLLDTGKFWAGMILDPIATMQRMGTATATVRVMTASLGAERQRNFLYLTGADNVAPVYLDPETFRTSNVPRRAHGGGAQARLRKGLIGSQGAEHAHYRAAFQASTGRAMLAEFAGEVGRQADLVVRALPDDRPIDLVACISDLVRYYSIVGMYRDGEVATALQIGRDITTWIDLAYAPGTLAFPLRLPGTPYARFMRAAENLEKSILDWTSLRRGMDPGRDLLSRFVNGPDEHGKPLAPDRLVGQVMTLFAASFSSSVAAVLWTLFLLMQHPDVAHDLCDELDGAGLDPSSDWEKLLNLKLLDQVCKESMRLFPPVPYQMRRVTHDAEVGDAEAAGVAVRRGDVIVIGCWGHNRLADVFTDPTTFRPERWATSEFGLYDSLTFSAGPRRCVGFSLAMIMIKVTLATILASRRPRILPQTRIDMRVAINLRTHGPIPVVMARRDQDFQRVPVGGTVTRLFTQPNPDA